uniref:AKTx n=1 Tax=Romanomermis culicivorax TaxID=13658 RepID=A0A915KH66_ROMCU
MKAVLIIVPILMLGVMDPVIKSNSPSFVEAATCNGPNCSSKCKLRRCDNGFCSKTGDCVCISC